MQRVLFVCTHNTARSQMAEGLLRHLAGHEFEVFSAGTEPGAVHGLAIEAMAEIGIDISAQRSKTVDQFLRQDFDYVITVCDKARETCPLFPGATTTLHWSFRDPAAARGSEASRLARFRAVRDEIAAVVGRFVSDASNRRGGESW